MSATVTPERWQGFNFLFKTKGKNELNFKMQILKKIKEARDEKYRNWTNMI